MDKEFGNGENNDGVVVLKLIDINEFKVANYKESYLGRFKFEKDNPEAAKRIKEGDFK